MAFRETIEAVLRAKDAARFKAEFTAAAKAVGKFSREEKQASATSKVLERIEAALARQSAELSAVMIGLSHTVDEFGDEMLQAAAKTAAANQVMKKSGSNAVFLGKSWAFWKDRLSLTRSEILTTSLTIGAYFSPAILAMGSSFAYAALGGGGVFAGGLSSFLFGLGLLSTVIRPALAGLKDIRKAQDQYNVAVAQYGAASKEASRASAHLGAIVEVSGGPAARNAATQLTDLAKAWKEITKPARGEFFRTLTAGLSGLGALLPQLGQQTNAIAAATGRALRGGINRLLHGQEGGGDIRETIKVLGDTFQKSIGPGVRGATSLIIVFSRIVRGAAPYVVKLSKAFENFGTLLLDKTSNQDRTNKFFANAVKHFKAWWGLAKVLGRTLALIFSNSQGEGLKVVGVLTNLVDKFNDWLFVAQNTGRIDEFWRRYNQSVKDAVWALQNPVDAIRLWLPQVMDAIATTLATHAPGAAGVFIEAFLNSGSWAQLLTVAWFLKKFGFFKALGKQVSVMFLTPFLENFVLGFTSAFITASAGEGAIARAMTTAGKTSGRLFAAGLVIGILAALVEFGPSLAKKIGELLHAGKMPGTWKEIFQGEFQALGDTLGRIIRPDQWPGIPFRQLGGMIPPGGAAIVGEAGPEIASMSKQGGTQITPLGKSINPVIDVPNISGAMHVTVFSSVQVDRREIGRAVSQQTAYDQARRGGHRVED